MSYWILVFFMGGFNSGGPFTLEFETERQCRDFIEDVKNSKGLGMYMQADCVEVKDEQYDSTR